MENPRPRPVRTQPPQARGGKKAFLLGMLSAALVGTGVGFFVLKALRPQPTIVTKPVPTRPRDSAFQQAKSLIREGRWVEAKARLLELQALEPHYPGLVGYLERVEKELPNQEHLAAAKAALATKMLAVAKAQLDQISKDTTMFEQVHQLKRELRDAATARVSEAEALLNAGQREQAFAILADVVAVFPDDRLARATFERAQPLPFMDSGSPAWDLVVRDFVQVELSSAMVLAEACAPKVPRCKSGLKDLKEFSRLLAKMDDLDPEQLTRLVVLDQKITGASGPSRATEKVRLRQANILYKNAAAAKATGAWQRAMEFSRLTLQTDPNHRGAAGILEELRSKAKDKYLRAYQLAGTDLEEALPLFREAMAMTPPDDEIHRKARNWVEKLDPQRDPRR